MYLSVESTRSLAGFLILTDPSSGSKPMSRGFIVHLGLSGVVVEFFFFWIVVKPRADQSTIAMLRFHLRQSYGDVVMYCL
jgi:hypothetical protein